MNYPLKEQSTLKRVFHQLDSKFILCSTSKGILIFNGHEWKRLDRFIEGTLASTNIWAVHEDAKEQLWVGFSAKGIQIINDGKIINFNPKNEIENLLSIAQVYQFFEIGTSMFVATSYGLFELDLDLKVNDWFSFEKNFSKNKYSFESLDIIRVIQANPKDANEFFTGGTIGMALLNVKTKKWKHFPMPEELIEDALAPQFTTKNYTNLMVTDLLIEKDKVYCATWGNGLMIFDLLSQKWEVYGFQPTTLHTPMDENIAAKLLPFQDSLILVSTINYEGVQIFNKNTLKFIPFEDVFSVNPEQDFSEGMAIFGESLFIAYNNSIDRVFLNSKTPEEKQLNKDIEIIKITHLDSTLWEFNPFRHNDFPGSFPASLDKITLSFLNPNYDRQPVEFAIHDTSEILVSETLSIDLNLKGGENIFFYRGQGSQEWKMLKFYRQPLWFEEMSNLVILFLAVSLVTSILIFEIRRKKANREKEKLALENKILDLERQALRTQINPHFIFNSLVSIKSKLISGDKKTATDFVNEFAKFIRTVLQYSNRDSVNLKEEIEVLNNYVSIESKRFGFPIQLLVNYEESMLLSQILVPPLILQPYIENSIWHGLAPLKRPGKIEINFSRNGNNIIIEILDDGVGLKQEQNKFHKSFGTEITQNRLDSFFCSQVKVLIQNRHDSEGCKVLIAIPIKKV